MHAKGIAIVALGLALAGCGNDRPEWMQDAWLHEVDQERWSDSLPRMKLATAGVWMSRLDEQGMLSLDKPVEDMEPEARELVSCLDAALAGGTGISSERLSRYFALCVQGLGYDK